MATKNKYSRSFENLLLIVLIFLILGCSEDSVTANSDATAIIGEWKWIKSIDAWSQQERTPDSEGYSSTIKFKTNDTVESYKNGTLISTYPYELRYRKNDFLNPNSDSTLVLVINNGTESFFSVDNDTLVISQSYVDGPINYYIK